jgi:hypothetical protein
MICQFRLVRAAGALAALFLLAAHLGCQRPQASTGGQSQQALLRRADRGEALLDAAVNQLRDLPAYVTTELRLPEVVLDSTKSSDGKDVLARATVNPNLPDGPINYFSVPARNARFRTLGVKPGDILKFHAAFDPESLEAGFEERVALELSVAQVLDENTLLVVGGLNQEATIPEKIEVWRYVDDRLVEISRQLRQYDLRRLPVLSWQPSADAPVLDQIVVQINQWLRQSEPKTDWRVDPLLATLDSDLAANKELSAYISDEALAAPFFQPYDGRLLQEAVWARDISRWARGKSFEKLARAEALFDWTVRNIQLVEDASYVAERPWQTLLYGRGTAEQRAWVFALLCRQQGLDVVMLGIAPPTAEAAPEGAAASPSETKFWLAALVDGDELYLFDPRLGLPIPGADLEGVATLKQVQQDDGVLRQLDLKGNAYPVTAEQLKNVVAYVVADPFDLTRRVRQVEAKLSGDDQLVLSARAGELAERLKSTVGIKDVRIWNFPFRVLVEQLTLGRSARNAAAMKFEPFAWRPILWKARTRHFQGRKERADASNKDAAEELVDDHRDAARYYMHKSIRPTDREIAMSSEQEARIRRAAKLNATYWLGLLSYDTGRHDVAARWFGREELTNGGSPWSAGAQYNLACTLEARGKFSEAADLLEKDSSPQTHGNRLRAKWLRKRAAAAEANE